MPVDPAFTVDFQSCVDIVWKEQSLLFKVNFQKAFDSVKWDHLVDIIDEASEVIISFIKKSQVNLQLQAQRVRTDNGMEFKNKTLAKFFDKFGITQQFFAARMPQQNGIVERRNRTLVEPARKDVIQPSSNTQSIPINVILNGDEASTSHNVFNERLEDAYFDASTSFHDPSNVHTYYQPYPHEKK
nr:hypothetical protein [Tanacetum cinerariifolium]